MSLVRRIAAAIKRPDSPPRHVVTDAVWVVEPTEYVDSRPVPKGSLFDDPERLDRAWAATLASYRNWRGPTPKTAVAFRPPPNQPNNRKAIVKLTRKKIIAGIAVAAAAVATLSGAANATSPVSTTKTRVGYNYGCEIPVKGSSVPLLDIHGPYTGHNACGAGHHLDVIWMGTLPTTTGPKGATGATGATGAKGATGATGAAGPAGANGTDAQALPYGIALVNVSRGGATAATWGSFSTTIGSPVGDTASGTFRMSCSAAKAPCVISVQAYATTSGVTVYPRLDISKDDINTGAAVGNCEYGDGTDNNGSTVAVGNGVANVTAVPLGIGGTLDCGSAQTYPTNGIATEIDVPAGYYDIAATFTFKK